MRRTPLIAATLLSIAALSSCAAPAYAASDSPTPYSVTVEGVTLPAGVVFADGGHVNWTTTTGNHSIHFESLNGQPSGQYIGKSFLPFDLAEGECVTWVQVAGFDEHFGEAGEEPICKGATPSTPVPSAQPESSPTPTPAIPAPSSSPSPSVPESTTPPAVSTQSPTPTGSTALQASRAPAPRLAETGSDKMAEVRLIVGFALFGGLLLLAEVLGRYFGGRRK